MTAWELFTFGAMPYPGVANGVVYSKLVTGTRLPKPALCPDTMYQVMRACWLPLPEVNHAAARHKHYRATSQSDIRHGI